MLIRFHAKGYADIMPIQNAPGHGIDLIMRDRDGGILVVEVKSHRLEGKPRVSADMEAFAETRLAKAVSGSGHWKNVDADTLKHAVKFYKEILEKSIGCEASL